MASSKDIFLQNLFNSSDIDISMPRNIDKVFITLAAFIANIHDFEGSDNLMIVN